jgi:hypothetical protein
MNAITSHNLTHHHPKFDLVKKITNLNLPPFRPKARLEAAPVLQVPLFLKERFDATSN